MRDSGVACRPCFETLASLAPQHEVVVFQQVRPHPEEAAKWPSRRMGCNTDLRFQLLGACPNSRCSILSESDSRLGYEQVFSALEYRSDAASAAECAGLRAERPCIAVYR